MSIPGKVLIALLTSLVAAAVAAYLQPSYSFVGLLLPAAVASVASVVLSHRALPVPEAIATDTSASPAPAGKGREKSGPAKARGAQRHDGAREDKRQQQRGRTRNGNRDGKRNGERDGEREEKREEKREDRREDRRDGKRGAKRGPGDGRRGEKDTAGAGTDSRAGEANAAPRGEAEEGTVKWFNVTKGYGFIIRGSGEEIFVHHRSVLGEGRGRLDDGARVRFRVAQTDKGPQAEEVEPL